MSSPFKAIECKKALNYAVYLSPDSIESLDVKCYQSVAISAFSLSNPCNIYVSVFPDFVVKDDEILIPSWLATQLKDPTQVSLVKITEQAPKIATSVRIQKIRERTNNFQNIDLPPPLPRAKDFLNKSLQRLLNNTLISVNGRFAIEYFGSTHIFQVLNISTAHKSSEILVCKNDRNTKFELQEIKQGTNLTLEGLENTISEIKKFLHTPCGVLITGISGIGKTSLVKAILSDSNVQYLEAIAFETQPIPVRDPLASIIVIDGLDHLHLSSSSSSSSSSQSSATVLRLAAFIDEQVTQQEERGEDKRGGVVVIGIVREVGMVDGALRRGGRFDHVVNIPNPDQIRRVALLHHFLGSLVGNEVLQQVGEITRGYVARDLAKLARAACVQALRTPTAKEGSFSAPTLEDFKTAQRGMKASQVVEFHTSVKSVLWDDVGGFTELKDTLLKQIVWPITHPQTFAKLGLTAPSGILLHGETGCGKTHLALGLAGQSGVNLIFVQGPQLFSRWLGETERNVRELFKQARQAAPCIIVLDEIDALGAGRSTDDTEGAGAVGWRVLAQLLAELDGVHVSAGGLGVTVIGCTSRVDLLDPALIRPGRLTPHLIPTPTNEDRLAILKIAFKKMWQGEEQELASLAETIQGWSPARIVRLCHDAGLIALKENGKDTTRVTMEHIEKVLAKYKTNK